jgi:hypothetical protein
MTKLFLPFLLIITCSSALLVGSVDIRWNEDIQTWTDYCQEGFAPESVRTINWQAPVPFRSDELPKICTQKLSTYPNTSTLNFSNYPFFNAAAEHFFVQNKKYPSITSLNISESEDFSFARNHYVNVRMIALVQARSHVPGELLTAVDSLAADFSLTRAESIAGMLSAFPNLQRFAFSQNQHFPCSAVFSVLLKNPNLQALTIPRSLNTIKQVREGNWAPFITNCSSLKKLAINAKSSMNPQDWSDFCQALGESNVTDLAINIPFIQEQEVGGAVDTLLHQGILSLHSLTSLELDQLPYSSACIESIAQLIENSRLTRLQLTSFQGRLPDHGTQRIIAALGNNRTITKLSLLNNNISTRGLDGLSVALSQRMPVALDTLELFGNQIGVMKPIAEALIQGHSFQKVTIDDPDALIVLLQHITDKLKDRRGATLSSCTYGGINTLGIAKPDSLSGFTSAAASANVHQQDKIRLMLKLLPISTIISFFTDPSIVEKLTLKQEDDRITKRTRIARKLAQGDQLTAIALKDLYDQQSYYHPRFVLKGRFQVDSQEWRAFTDLKNQFAEISEQPEIKPTQARFLAILALLAKL